MRGLTLTQPWATLVAIGAKEYETRSWGTTYRGPLAIHAAKGFPEDDRWLCDRVPYRDALKNAGIARPTFTLSDGSEQSDIFDGTRFWGSVLPRGAIVAVANLHKCARIVPFRAFDDRPGIASQELPVSPEEVAFGDWTSGRFGWSLTSVRPLPNPIPFRGALGLWEVPADLAARLERWWLNNGPLEEAGG